MKPNAAPKRACPLRKPAWKLCLYVADRTPLSLAAYANLKKFCEERLHCKYHIDVIDVLDHPERARAENIVALPTLIRRIPKPLRRVIGDLSITPRVMAGLDVQLSG